MAISFVGAANASDSANDDITVTGFSGIQDGDLILGWYHGYGDTSTTALPVTLSGFTKLTDRFEQGGSDCSMTILYKIASSESGDYAFVGSHVATPETGAHIVVYRGVDQANPFDITYVQANHYVRNVDFAPSGSPWETQPKDITTNTDNAWCVILTAVMYGNTTDIVPPAGFTERSQIIAPSRNGHVCDKLQATAGSVSPGAIAATNASTATDASHMTIALKSASAVTVTFDLVSKAATLQSSLSSVAWAWFDEDVGALNAPTDKGNIEISDSSGEMILNLSNTTLTSGQTGTLALYDSTDGKIGAYRLSID